MSDRKGLLRITGKGRKVREVPVNSETRKYLKEYLKVKPNSPYLFVSQKGGKMERSTIFRSGGGNPLQFIGEMRADF